MADVNAITVGHTVKLNIVVFNKEPVLIFDMIDQAHSRRNGTASDRFRENRKRFVEGKHYYMVSYAEAEALRPYGVNVPPRGLTLITKRGYLLLVKSFTDDLAWDVQEQLVDYYFDGQPQRSEVDTVSAIQLRQIRDQVENVTRYLKHRNLNLAHALYKLLKNEFGYDKIENLPSEDLPKVLSFIASYQDVAHQVHDVTAAIERGFVAAVKSQTKSAPQEVYHEVLSSLQAPLRIAIAA